MEPFLFPLFLCPPPPAFVPPFLLVTLFLACSPFLRSSPPPPLFPLLLLYFGLARDLFVLFLALSTCTNIPVRRVDKKTNIPWACINCHKGYHEGEGLVLSYSSLSLSLVAVHTASISASLSTQVSGSHSSWTQLSSCITAQPNRRPVVSSASQQLCPLRSPRSPSSICSLIVLPPKVFLKE